MQPRDVMIQWLYKNIPDLIIQPEDRSEVDIVGEVNGNGSKSIYSVDVHERWVEELPENWRYIYNPMKNKKLRGRWVWDQKNNNLNYLLPSCSPKS